MGKIFGTDGARGIANKELTCELAMNIGRAAALVLIDSNHRHPRILIGKDTRISSDMLECALKAGICSVGANAVAIGVVPTPAVAYLVKKYNADAGIMISASHNSYEFNGIKIFSRDGYKLPDSLEEKIENIILNNMQGVEYKTNDEIGRVSIEPNAVKDYIEHIKSTIEGDLKGIKVAFDCSNGSASSTARKLFEELGVESTILNDNPNGLNINDGCGSTKLDYLSKYVKENNVDIGIAFDGDADRCLAIDENGEEVDGDYIMAICSKGMKDKKVLSKNTVVGTIMTNMGFSDFCDKGGIKFEASKVGDRYVLEKMLKEGYNFGGEQSGHVIFKDFSTTGDGQLTAVQLIKSLLNSKVKLCEAKKIMEKYPQVIKNVKVDKEKKSIWKDDEEISNLISKSEKEIDGIGRIIVRESGTEPLIRVMVECKDKEKMNKIVNSIAEKIFEKIG